MKTIFFHMQGYRDLPDDFAKRYESIWVTPPNDELCDPEKVAKYLRWNVEELELADDLGFDGLGVNEHHQNGYGFCNSPNLIASILARRNSDAAIVVLGDTLPLHNPPIRVAEEFAMIDCLSGGRLVAGFPVGSPPDTVGNYGTPPTQVRPRYYEAHDLIMQAWTKPGPFPFNGEFTKLRYVNPWPKPLQKPHPPVWLAGGGGFAQLVVVGATDAEAEKLYLKHLRNFYSKALHIPVYMNAVPGFMTKRSAEFALRQGAVRGAHKTILGDPRTASWKDLTESRMVIGGSPDTVAQQLEEAIRNLRIGHLMALFQIQSMDRELTEYSLRLFADKVLPKVRGIWAKEGYEDRWWPQGATRNSRRKAVAAAEAAL